MCRDNDHGGNRCKSDTSDARRKRRKAQKARESHLPQVAGRGSHVQRWDALSTMPAIIAEAKEIKALLAQPVEDVNSSAQMDVDDEMEKRVTRLGLAIGEEADRRTGFSEEAYKARRAQFATDIRRLEEEEDEILAKSKKIREMRSSMTESEYSEAMGKIFDESASAYQSTGNMRDAEQAYDAEMTQKQTEAYLAVLSELRELGGTPVVHPASESVAAKNLHEAISKKFPSDWIRASNESGPMIVKESDVRSFYASVPMGIRYNENGAPAKNLLLMADSVKAQMYVDKMKADGDDSLAVFEVPDVYEYEGGGVYVVSGPQRIAFDPSTDPVDNDGNPAGDHWKYGYVFSGSEPWEEQLENPARGWYRYQYEQVKEDGTHSALASMRLPSYGYGNGIESTACHEFTHRAEDVVHDEVLTRLQSAFLYRRTTTKAGVQNPVILLYPENHEKEDGSGPVDLASFELARKGGFIIDYVGKQYLASKSKEVLTIGAEAAFAGKYGSFVGIEGYKKDLDHRGFFLGTLATA